ncbi:MAG: cohesin domain-containing protein [Chitinophagales bacterium]|nr:cohesin domain-containing protein [Chitinophagales bacterium]
MKKILLFLLVLGIWACQADTSQDETNTGQSTTAPIDAVNEVPSESTPTKQPEKSKPQAPAEKPEVGNREAYVPPTSEDVLILEAGSLKLKKGSTACLDIKAKQFRNLLSMQYTMSWDPKVAKFNKVSNFGLPYIGQQNFGGTRLTEGLLSFVWIDNQLKGTTLPDNSTIFTVCFDGVGEAGTNTQFKFVEKPTPFEVVNLQEEIQQLEPKAGTISIVE